MRGKPTTQSVPSSRKTFIYLFFGYFKLICYFIIFMTSYHLSVLVLFPFSWYELAFHFGEERRENENKLKMNIAVTYTLVSNKSNYMQFVSGKSTTFSKVPKPFLLKDICNFKNISTSHSYLLLKLKQIENKWKYKALDAIQPVELRPNSNKIKLSLLLRYGVSYLLGTCVLPNFNCFWDILTHLLSWHSGKCCVIWTS